VNSRFWTLIFALSLINFGVDFIVGGTTMASAYKILVWSGSWMTLAGVGIMTWLVLNKPGK
jgi:hypothetical protein